MDNPTRPAPTQIDYAAADDIIERASLKLPPEPSQSDAFRQHLAELHAKYGRDRLELRFGLRLPRTKVEEVEAAFWQGKLPESEFGELLKEQALRPIDLEMLRSFYTEFNARLSDYRGLWCAVAAFMKSGQTEPAALGLEAELDELARKLKEPLAIWRSHITTVSEFLTEVRAASGLGPVRSSGFVDAFAHGVAWRVFCWAAEQWQKRRLEADESVAGADGAEETTAASSFFHHTMTDLPGPDEIEALLALERAEAESALRSRLLQRSGDERAVHVTAQSCTVVTQSLAPQSSVGPSVESPSDRSEDQTSADSPPKQAAGHGLVVNHDDFSVTFRGITCPFPKRQGLLFALMRRLAERGSAIPVERLFDPGDVWDGREVELSTVRGTATRLRQHLRKSKLGAVADAITIWTVRGQLVIKLDFDQLKRSAH